MIELTSLNRNEAKRYLGGAKIELDERMSELFYRQAEVFI